MHPCCHRLGWESFIFWHSHTKNPCSAVLYVIIHEWQAKWKGLWAQFCFISHSPREKEWERIIFIKWKIKMLQHFANFHTKNLNSHCTRNWSGKIFILFFGFYLFQTSTHTALLYLFFILFLLIERMRVRESEWHDT
jgi:hypothetical protein